MENLDVIMQAIGTAIGTIGFPIVMTLIMFYFLNKEQENHKAEMNGLKEVIAGNNKVLAQLKQLIEDKLK